MENDSSFIDDGALAAELDRAEAPTGARLRELLAKAGEHKGLSRADVAALSKIAAPEDREAVYAAARETKDAIYGRRLVLFAPLYISNLCGNECLYCAFRARNKEVRRRALSQAEVAEETRKLVEQGHKRVLLVAGESYPGQKGFDYVLESIATIYATRSGPGEVRRVNANVAPLTLDEFARLKATGIGTYQLFQETYHRETYKKVHVGGKKTDYDWRVTAIDRAMASGISDCGLGVLFGLAPWRFDVLALLAHIEHLEKAHGVGPHTLSVPRMEPAVGSDMALHPPQPVSDDDFRLIIALLRLAVPYTGIILSTRETAEMRREALALGVSQISAGSRTNPGGYGEEEKVEEAQFFLGDHRGLDEVVRDAARMGYVPSFCTGCYRLGRVGKDFMDLARPGDIKAHCDPNGLSTFLEYLLDYASPATKTEGLALIDKVLGEMTPENRASAETLLARVRAGERDVYC